jgi:3' terminal RNA ribose 2'-O-methyltransferase Hen1
MLLSISVEGAGADTLSYVVQKHPAKIFEKGNLRLFFPKYDKNASSLVAMAEFPEFKLWDKDTPGADAYVSSREYALSSLFCRELKGAFGTVLSGKYKDEKDQKMAETPLEVVVDALPLATSLTDEQLRSLFQPLRYAGFTPSYTVDHSYQYPWMPQRHRVLELALRGQKTIREVLRHLLVLIPAIDNYTHYTELDTLVAELKNYGEGWLDQHPKKAFITARFLRNSRKLIKEFDGAEEKKQGEAELEKRIFLGELRTNWFLDTVKRLGARSVVDAGCGSGRLAEAMNKAGVLEVSAFDCHGKAVQAAKYHLENKANVFFSSLMYRDDRLLSKDAILLQEVVEHMPAFQLRRAMELIFKVYRPKWVLMSTPNRSYNKIFGMPEGAFRHRDHKFEFDEAEAKRFCDSLPGGYKYAIEPIGQDYVPPTPQESAEINERMGRLAPDGKSELSPIAVMDPPKSVHTEIAPTFGFVFERLDQ